MSTTFLICTWWVVGAIGSDPTVEPQSEGIISIVLAMLDKAQHAPIHDAATERDPTEIKRLLDQGADINQRDERGRTALYLAALNGREQIVELLLAKGAGVDIGASWKGERKALHAAADKGHIGIVKLLLTNGAKVDAKDSGGITPLVQAAWSGHAEVVDVLIKAGANVNHKVYRQYSALHYQAPFKKDANIEGYLNTVDSLVAAGADVNAKAHWFMKGYTPLMSAIVQDAPKEIIERLIKRGADVNARAEDGVTALEFAEHKKRQDIVEILKRAGAKRDIPKSK